jgi:hypothetical protein
VNKSGKCRAIAEPRRQLVKFSFHFTHARRHVIDGRRQEDLGPDLMSSGSNMTFESRSHSGWMKAKAFKCHEKFDPSAKI